MKRKSHRFLASITAIMMVLTFMASPVFAAAQRFKDVPTSRWYYEYVENLAKRKIVGGFGTSGEFRPDNKVERQHVAKMVTMAAGLPYKGKRANFPDVASDNVMSPFIAALQEKGIIKGYDDGTFKPTKTVTRAEVSVMIAKAFDLKIYGTATSMRDIKGHWAEGLIKILISNGIVKGYADGTFRPNNPVTRAELSKMLSVTMAVAGVQKAESTKTKKAASQAQALIDSLPSDQDVATKQTLQDRLMKLMLPDKNGGWHEQTDAHPSEGIKITIHYNGVMDNHNDYADTEQIMPFYVIIENIGLKEFTFYKFDLEMIDSAGMISSYSYLSSYSTIGKMKLTDLPSGVGIIPGGKVEGYLYFEVPDDVVPVRLRYKPYSDVLIDFYLD